MTDLLQEFNCIAGIDHPIQKINVLHEPDRIGAEAETLATTDVQAPHVIPRIAPIAWQRRGKFSHQEGKVSGEW